MRYTLRQLEVFTAIGRVENVSRAAEMLALSQSATSTALGEFERQFDCRLFDRVGKSLKLNEFGRILLPMAMALLDQASEIENVLQGKKGLGSLQIGATLTVGNYLATLLIGSFMQRHPECQIKLHVRNTSSIVQQVARYELDLGMIEGDCNHPDLIVEPWVEDELAVFCAPNHPLAKRAKITINDLLSESWILREPGSGTRETFDQALRHHRSRLQIKLELEHTEAIKRAVESGLGIGCVSRLALREASQRGTLIILKTPMLDLRRQFLFLWHRKKYQTAGMREFLAHCRKFTEGVKRSDEINLTYHP